MGTEKTTTRQHIRMAITYLSGHQLQSITIKIWGHILETS